MSVASESPEKVNFGSILFAKPEEYPKAGVVMPELFIKGEPLQTSYGKDLYWKIFVGALHRAPEPS